MTDMKTTYDGLVARVLLETSNIKSARAGAFHTIDSKIEVHAHPALIPLLRAHLYYDWIPRPLMMNARDWRVDICEGINVWDTIVDELPLKWVPILEYGADGFSQDISDKIRVIGSRKTRSVIVVNKDERRVVILGYDIRSCFAEGYKVIRSLLTQAAFNAGRFPLHTAAISRAGR